MERPCQLPILLTLLVSLSLCMSRATAVEIPASVPPPAVNPFSPTAPGEDVRLADDAYHYRVFADGHHDGQYLEMGDAIRQPVGEARIEFQGEITRFTTDHYHLRHLRWAFDVEHRHWYPLHTLLHAENETRRLLLRLQTIDTQPLRGDLPWPLADMILYEQTAHYDGQLWEKTAEGPWVLLVAFSGHGFKEYTAKSRQSLRFQGQGSVP